MNEVVAVVKYIGVIILVVAGLSLAVPGGVRVFERMSSTVMGLLIAVEAVSLMAWLTT
jgi:hypothetical protein